MQQLLLELAPPPLPTLENFSVGKNGAALKALREALEDGERFVFLWGASGSGKTHLLRGFAEAAGAKGHAAYVQAANADWTPTGNLAAVAVDEVSRLDDAGQVALFDLCNRLRTSGGALAASADAPPALLALRPDLRSRLASGIVFQLHALDDGDKAAALREHAAARGMALGEDLIRHLLTHFDRDMGTQIAMLDALDKASLERKRPLTLPLLKDALRALSEREASS